MIKINSVLAINKPEGFTSFDVVARVRALLKIKKVGHAGTLDPMATGVLPVLIGKATKVCDLILDEYKEYLADFKLGITTDTLDITGKELTRCEVKVLQDEILRILPNYTGEIWQTVPMFSAVKVGGKRLYVLARQGLDVPRPKKLVKIEKMQLLEYDELSGEGKIKIGCARGTYVRAIISDLGSELGCGAVLTALCRTKSCGLTIEQTCGLDQLEWAVEAGTLASRLIGLDYFFLKLKRIDLSDEQAVRFMNGAKLPLGEFAGAAGEIVRIHHGDCFLGLAQVDLVAKELRTYKLLV